MNTDTHRYFSHPNRPGLLEKIQIPTLNANEVHVWRGRLDLPGDVLVTCEGVLSEDEQERASRFKFARDRGHYVACRGILRHFLGAYSGQAPEALTLEYGEKGKPRLVQKATGLAFNVSHSHSVALWAFGIDRMIGVDVEWMGRSVNVEAIGKRFFSDSEWTSLQKIPQEERRRCFFQCWTRKEAFVKALGDGLTFSLKAFDVCVDGTGGLLRLEDDHDPDQWTLHGLNPVGDYVGALAFDGQAEIVCLDMLVHRGESPYPYLVSREDAKTRRKSRDHV